MSCHPVYSYILHAWLAKNWQNLSYSPVRSFLWPATETAGYHYWTVRVKSGYAHMICCSSLHITGSRSVKPFNIYSPAHYIYFIVLILVVVVAFFPSWHFCNLLFFLDFDKNLQFNYCISLLFRFLLLPWWLLFEISFLNISIYFIMNTRRRGLFFVLLKIATHPVIMLNNGSGIVVCCIDATFCSSTALTWG